MLWEIYRVPLIHRVPLLIEFSKRRDSTRPAFIGMNSHKLLDAFFGASPSWGELIRYFCASLCYIDEKCILSESPVGNIRKLLFEQIIHKKCLNFPVARQHIADAARGGECAMLKIAYELFEYFYNIRGNAKLECTEDMLNRFLLSKDFLEEYLRIMELTDLEVVT